MKKPGSQPRLLRCPVSSGIAGIGIVCLSKSQLLSVRRITLRSIVALRAGRPASGPHPSPKRWAARTRAHMPLQTLSCFGLSLWRLLRKYSCVKCRGAAIRQPKTIYPGIFREKMLRSPREHHHQFSACSSSRASANPIANPVSAGIFFASKCLHISFLQKNQPVNSSLNKTAAMSVVHQIAASRGGLLPKRSERRPVHLSAPDKWLRRANYRHVSSNNAGVAVRIGDSAFFCYKSKYYKNAPITIPSDPAKHAASRSVASPLCGI